MNDRVVFDSWIFAQRQNRLVHPSQQRRGKTDHITWYAGAVLDRVTQAEKVKTEALLRALRGE